MNDGAALGASVLEHFRRPRNHRPLESPSAVGIASNASCGDRVEIAIRVGDDGRVRDAAFQGEACSVAVAAASVVTELARGLTVAEAGQIGEDAVRQSLGEVPAGRQRCASLAPAALGDALARLRAGATSMTGVAGLVLAGGSGTRFGGSKLTELLDGRPVIAHAASALLDAGLRRVVVVVGGIHAALVREALSGMPVEIVERPGDGGIGDSLAAGVRALAADADVLAIVVALGDQPRVPVSVPGELVRALRESGRQIAVPEYRGERAHPVLFSREMFPALMQCAGDRGAAGLIASSGDAVAKVQFDVAAPGDVDTAAALAALRAESSAHSR